MLCLLVGAIMVFAGLPGGGLLMGGAAVAITALVLQWRLSPDLDRVIGSGYLELIFGPGEDVPLPTGHLGWHLRAVAAVLAPVILLLPVHAWAVGPSKRHASAGLQATRNLGGLAAFVGLFQCGCLLFGFRDVDDRMSDWRELREIGGVTPDGLDPAGYFPVLAVITLGVLGTAVAGLDRLINAGAGREPHLSP